MNTFRGLLTLSDRRTHYSMEKIKMKKLILFSLLIYLTGCASNNVKDVKKGVISPSCALCQHSIELTAY